MAASMEKALARLTAKFHDRIRGAGCQVVRPLAYDRKAETALLLPRSIDGAASAGTAEHAKHVGV